MPSLSVLNILRTIKEHGTLSRTDLQNITRLSWGTITNTTRELLERNLIREEGTLHTKAGRKPMRLAINPVTHVLIGVDIAPRLVRCVAMNLAGETLDYRETPYDIAEPAQSTLERVGSLIVETLHQPSVASRSCLGVGVAVQGAVDVKRGVMRFAPRMPGWINVPIREYLQLKVAAPVLVEHAPNCLALAERWFGEASAAEDVICIHLGEGVGMGILHDGDLYRGAQQMAGEFGHVTLDPEGPPCACGDRGCVESYCSVPAVLDALKHEGSTFTSPIDVTTAAKAGDEKVRAVLGRMGHKLGLGVANLIDLFNPTLVILSGQLAPAADFFLPAVREQVGKHAWKQAAQRILISTLGDRAVAIGACGTVLQSVFEQDVAAGNGEAVMQRVS